jgi:hypothetical protein
VVPEAMGSDNIVETGSLVNEASDGRDVFNDVAVFDEIVVLTKRQ